MEFLAKIFENSFVAFIILLGILVFVHEYGHYITAKLFGVTVEVFSIGFGPKIASFKRGDTEYKLSAIPLGGFVKMFGDNYEDVIAEEDKARAFVTQPPLKKALIAFAGPLFNFVLAIIIYQVFIMTGIPSLRPEIGYVLKGGAANKAGLNVGDTIISANEESVETWSKFVSIISNHPGKPVQLKIKRTNSKIEDLSLTPDIDDGVDVFGLKVKKGLIGVSSEQLISRIWITNPQGIFAKLGLNSGDVINTLQDQSVIHHHDLIIKLQQEIITGTSDITLKYLPSSTIEKDGEKSNTPKEKTVTILRAEINQQIAAGFSDIFSILGFERMGFVIKQAAKDSPAYLAGLQVMDKILTIDGTEIDSFYVFRRAILNSKKETHTLVFIRNGKRESVSLKKVMRVQKNRLGMENSSWYVGVTAFNEFTSAQPFLRKELNPFVAFVKAIKQMIEVSKLLILSIFKLIIGDISIKTLGGPLTIAKFASEAAKAGFFAFLNMMALISLNLGLVNLFPIPVLDGGHIVFSGIEAITRKPINKRVLSISYMLGFGFIILLILFTIVADLVRFGPQFMAWISPG